MKRLISLVLVTLMAFALVAGAQAESKGTIAVVCYANSGPYFACGEETAIETGKRLGYDVIWTGTPDPDGPGFINIITNLVEQGVDAMCIASGDTESVVPILQEAMAKGIKVITLDLDINPAGRNFYAGLMELDTELGIPQVESVVASMGDTGEYAIITGVLTNEFLANRIEFCINYAKENYPNLECVAVESMEEDPEKCYSVAQNILTVYPNVKAIMSNVSSGVGPISRAIEDAGKIGEVFACGQSMPSLAKPGMKSGACINAYLWDPAKWQEWAVTLAAYAVEGKLDDMPIGKVEIEGFPLAERYSDDTFYYHESFVFTPENIDNFDF